MLNKIFGKDVYTDLTVLIATKDRLNQLTKLLSSLENSTKLPGTVIIAYNGIDIESEIERFNTSFQLIIIESDTASQVYQKKLGLRALPFDCKWILFLDDDVVIEPDSIELLYERYIFNPSFSNYGGFGLAIKNRVYRNTNWLVQHMLHAIKLHSSSPGDVTKGGHPQSYLSQTNVCEVKWLNGLSIWSRKVIDQYFDIPLISDYAAYEDVMFSHTVGKKCKLLFASDIFVLDQILENDRPLSSKQFVAGCYARYFFVDSNPDMSKFWMLTGQIIRNIDFVLRSKHEGNYLTRMQLALKSFFVIFLSSIKIYNPIKLIQ
jgi:glycosyltransferase involved in cell wall biosynthesis